MSPERAAQCALALFLCAGLALVVVDIVRSRLGWGAWFLYALQRAYVGLWFHWRANRRCPFPSNGPAIIVANHRSPVDPLMVWTNHHLVPAGTGAMRVIGFLMAREYYEMPGLRWLCRTMESIPADRNGRDVGPVKEALSRLRAGKLVGIFPEGRINSGLGLLPFGSGIAWLALRAEVPIYPVFIHSAARGTSMVKPFLRPNRVQVIYGDPIDLSAWHGRQKSPEALADVTALIRRRMAALGGIEADAGLEESTKGSASEGELPEEGSATPAATEPITQ